MNSKLQILGLTTNKTRHSNTQHNILSRTILIITILSKTTLNVKYNLLNCDTGQKNEGYQSLLFFECGNAGCRNTKIIMLGILNVVMLSITMLSVLMPSVMILSVTIPSIVAFPSSNVLRWHNKLITFSPSCCCTSWLSFCGCWQKWLVDEMIIWHKQLVEPGIQLAKGKFDAMLS